MVILHALVMHTASYESRMHLRSVRAELRTLGCVVNGVYIKQRVSDGESSKGCCSMHGVWTAIHPRRKRKKKQREIEEFHWQESKGRKAPLALPPPREIRRQRRRPLTVTSISARQLTTDAGGRQHLMVDAWKPRTRRSRSNAHTHRSSSKLLLLLGHVQRILRVLEQI